MQEENKKTAKEVIANIKALLKRIQDNARNQHNTDKLKSPGDIARDME